MDVKRRVKTTLWKQDSIDSRTKTGSVSAAGFLCQPARWRIGRCHKARKANPELSWQTQVWVSKLACLCQPQGVCVGRRARTLGAATKQAKRTQSEFLRTCHVQVTTKYSKHIVKSGLEWLEKNQHTIQSVPQVATQNSEHQKCQIINIHESISQEKNLQETMPKNWNHERQKYRLENQNFAWRPNFPID